MAEQTILAPENRELFSLHEEDDMTQARFHSAQEVYVEYALDRALPGWFVARNFAVYWVPGQRQYPYVGPDILASRFHPKQENPSVYLVYEDGPISFVAEIALDKTRRGERRKRDEIYAAALHIPEYVYVDFEKDQIQLWRLDGERYERVEPDSMGRLWSAELSLGFVWQEDHHLVRVLRADGTSIPTAQEETGLRHMAETAAQAERERAEVERERAEVERARADALAAELDRLRRAMRKEPQE